MSPQALHIIRTTPYGDQYAIGYAMQALTQALAGGDWSLVRLALDALRATESAP